MSLETEVASLTTATTNLLSAVTTSKETLDQAVADAEQQVGLAEAQAALAEGYAATANTQAGNAMASAQTAQTAANNAVAVVTGGTASITPSAGKIPVADATGQIDAGWVNPLPAVATTLHRSPSAITALCVYDTSKDSDGGAWTEKCQHTSWYQGALSGKWLGAQTSESAARAVSGAATGDYYQLTTDGKFYSLNAGSGTTEVFRGNKRSFPKLAAIVASAANVDVYDLTESSRPMWARYPNTGAMATGNIAALAAVNGRIFVGGASGLATLNFATDRLMLRNTTNLSAQAGLATIRTSARSVEVGTALTNAAIADLAVTVTSDAPTHPATGLKVPTVALATGARVVVIRNDGTLVNSSSTSAFTQVTLTPQLLSAGRADAVWYYAANPNALGASFSLSTKNASTATDFNVGNTTLLRAKDRANYARTSGAVVQILRNNEGAVGNGIAAKLSDTYNTGWLAGDIRRAYLANSKTADRSYKGATAAETGTVTSAAANTNTDLAAYSGFSGSNYIQEPYSADLDFGTGEWTCSAWVNVPAGLPSLNVLRYSNQFSLWSILNSVTVESNTAETLDPFGGNAASIIRETATTGNFFVRSSDGAGVLAPFTVSFYAKKRDRDYVVVRNDSGTGWAAFNLANGTFAASGQAAVTGTTESLGNGWHRCIATFGVGIAGSAAQLNIGPQVGANFSAYAGTAGLGIYIYGSQCVSGTSAGAYTPTTTELPVSTMMHRAQSSGPSLKISMTGVGKIQATAFDGTTTRTVTTSASCNTATWLKARVNYTTDGKLAILINGVEVASSTGSPLLTLNNSNAVLTIGNSYALDAPFPGSLALLKFSATVPTVEQALFMYEQEKQMFATGAKCVLPSSGNVLDLAYDDATDTWSTLQATHEASWSGLVRTATQTPSAGSFSRTAETSGVQLLSRTTTNPGVDVRMPVKNLRPKDMPRDINQDITVFDFDAVTNQTDFVLPVGYTARVVYSVGAQKRLGSTKDYTVLFDGFRETIRFAVAPGNGVWVQIHAVKEVSL